MEMLTVNLYEFFYLNVSSAFDYSNDKKNLFKNLPLCIRESSTTHNRNTTNHNHQMSYSFRLNRVSSTRLWCRFNETEKMKEKKNKFMRIYSSKHPLGVLLM